MKPGVRQLDSARVLRALGLRDQIHPRDAACFAYPSAQVFEESAKRDREIHGNDVLGPFETEGGLVGVVDIRPQLRSHGVPVTDPAGPDGAYPGMVALRMIDALGAP
jgi:hypothetical protein